MSSVAVPGLRTDVSVRFWSKVRRDLDCWEWTASTNEMGYGYFNIGGRCILAHRVAWELACGAIPDGLCVLHRCDNPRCVRPEHLFIGTRTDNAADKVAKGRQSHTSLPRERHPNAKLTEELVRQIRALAADGKSGAAIGRMFGLSTAHTCKVIKRDVWP